jgi:hypothetical protein
VCFLPASPSARYPPFPPSALSGRFADLSGTMAILRLPSSFPLRFVSFAGPYHPASHRFVPLRKFLDAKHFRSLVFFPSGLSPAVYHKPVCSDGDGLGLPGSWMDLRCLCPALGPRPRRHHLPLRNAGVAPARKRTKAAAFCKISRLYRRASALTVYASDFSFPTSARLASGGRLSLTGGYRTLGPLWRISIWLHSHLFQRPSLVLARFTSFALALSYFEVSLRWAWFYLTVFR